MQVIVVYATVAFILLQVASLLEDSMDLPSWFDKLVTILLVIGFPIAIIFSWIFDVSSKGISVTEPEAKKEPYPGSNTQVQEKSIIVLPFDNISSDPEQEYFSDGLTEEIITDLSYIKELLVISRSSAMSFKGSKKKIKEIANEVNVRYVLEGSVRKSGNDLRIVAQLIDAQTDTHLWAEKYTGKLDDIFNIQEKVSKLIAQELDVKLNNHSKNTTNIHDIKLFNAHYKAVTRIFRFTEEDMQKAIEELDVAIQEIGPSALLLSTKAWAIWHMVNMGIKPFEYLNEAENILQKALILDPNFPRNHAVLGWVILLKDFRLAITHFKKALNLDPNDATALQGIVVIISSLGIKSESINYYSRLQKIDPLNFLTMWLSGGIPFYQGDFKTAFTEWNKLFNNTQIVGASFFAAMSMLYFENKEKVLEFANSAINYKSNLSYDKLFRMLKYALEKNMDKFKDEFDENLKISCDRDCTMAHHLADFYSILNLKKEALYWLNMAITKGFINYPMIVEKDTLLDNIRGEKQFAELLVKAKQEWENFKV
ncbi:hypothetical protein [Maribellus sediminis]|uniref:hypothetical protein n=1 Tax=Maribellus sediminis TaxID=2696285 RepID=UPI0014319B7F|nr:hypothetical protein [Maribellus sediminis]